MVKGESIDGYKCPICNKWYKFKGDAEECIEEHNDHVPEPETRTVYKCEYCDKEQKEESDAISCEEKHIRWNDKYVPLYEAKKNREILDKAANHPKQKRLI